MTQDYLVKEVLRKKKKSLSFFILIGFSLVLILNILITLTNNLPNYRNTVSVGLLVIFGIIFLLMFERMFSTYVYLLSNTSIAFSKRTGKKDQLILEVPFNDIIRIANISEMLPNADVKNTYYFTYGEGDENCKYCEFTKEERLYRFVFCPSERIMRIIERKKGYVR
ncbi:MAG: hypothetical protein JXQ26_01410 [Tissierellales bacterium]|nr:hypothetical protein [Tissierellales bacterium]MBN2826614.1 hypothetical protein [Tissierellales bacterium]